MKAPVVAVGEGHPVATRTVRTRAELRYLTAFQVKIFHQDSEGIPIDQQEVDLSLVQCFSLGEIHSVSNTTGGFASFRRQVAVRSVGEVG